MIEALAGRRRPLRIGHMGAAGLAPGNSLAAIELALRVGVDLIELDVWRTSDDHLVLAHFPWVSPHPASIGGRLARGRALLRATSTWPRWPRIPASELATLRRLPVPPPTLEEALDLMRGRAMPYLDLRGSGAMMAQRVCDTLREGAPDGALLGSGPGRSFAAEIALLPTVRATSGMAVPLFGRAISDESLCTLIRRALRGARRNGASGLAVEYHLIRPPLLEICRQEGFFVFAWTVDAPVAMARLIALGVDGITTNRPDRLAALLA
ncbi:MAG TPA: glycerophosphodiester phosphodiesterase [Chloroflexota bacterium]|nr:glycerophosphodiester phosphodiesterase [Chloroflexota bacterium]